jgi:hypothetical protein
MNNKNMSDAPLKCEVVNGELVISVGVETLVSALENEGQLKGWQVVNNENFVKDLCRALVREDNGGNSLITTALDKASELAFVKEKKDEKDEWWLYKKS